MIERIVPNEVKYSSMPCSIVAVGTAYELIKSNELTTDDKKTALIIHDEAETLLGMVENVLSISKINLGLSYWNDGKPHYRIGMGALAITVLRVTKAEEFLEAAPHPLSDETIQEAAKYAIETAKPITDIRSTKEYRKQMAGVLLKRALNAIK